MKVYATSCILMTSFQENLASLFFPEQVTFLQVVCLQQKDQRKDINRGTENKVATDGLYIGFEINTY